MKKEDFINFFKKIKFFKKYNYDINRVIGVKDNEKYILLAEKKLIRIYRQNLKSTALLSSYIPIEHAIFYNFEVEKSVIENVDIDSFVEIKVYEEAGLLDTEEYLIKYEIVDLLKDERKVIIQCVIVPISFISKNYDYIIKETGYIDYLSFPAFAYESLYNENILKKGNDLFIVMLYDKIFFTFYSEGKLLNINTVSGGLDKIYESLQVLKIANFNTDLFKKLLIKKGIDKNKYNISEVPVLIKIEDEFKNYKKIIEEQIERIKQNFDISDVERIFITTEYGDIPGINKFFEFSLQKKVLGFEFAKEYNLDLLPIDPFLFLAMLETHNSYKSNDLKHNFSIFLRKPTFFYRPSGLLILIFLISLVLFLSYPIYLYINGLIYSNKIQKFQAKFQQLNLQKLDLIKEINIIRNKILVLQKKAKLLTNQIKEDKEFINIVYKFKFNYLPKSQELVNITMLMNKYKIYLDKLDYKNGIYVLKIHTYKNANIGEFIDALINDGFNVSFNVIQNKKDKYFTTIRIEE